MKKKIYFLLWLICLITTSTTSFAINYYVSPAPLGSNTNTGTNATAPFATIQKAHDVSNAGDTIFIMDGTYSIYNSAGDIVTISRSGTLAAPIVYTKYPGSNPIINPTSWNGFKVTYGASYIVIDGLTVVGNNANLTLAGALAQPGGCSAVGATPNPGTRNSTYNTNGIYVDGSQVGGICHHVVIKNCLVYNCDGGGISTKQADYITITNNTVHDNCKYGAYGGSGISNLNNLDWDNNTIDYKVIVRDNIVYNNEMLEPWYGYNCQITDGNGIIFDSNNNSTIGQPAYTGKSLCENNIVYNNGGRGIHVFISRNVTILNNTCYQNCRSSSITDGDINVSAVNNVKVYSNIIFARSGRPATKVASDTNVVADYNLIFNSTQNGMGGLNTIFGNPNFTDTAAKNFTLLPTSPAINVGSNITGQFSTVDILDVIRPFAARPCVGAYEFTGVASVGNNFKSGNLVALRANAASNSTADSITLVEYTQAGTATGFTVGVPATNAGARLTIGGNTAFEGQLSLSGDGRYLCFGGYDVAKGTNTAGQYAATKMIAKVDNSGNVNLGTMIPTTVAFNGTGTGTAIRSVVSQDGSGFWVTCAVAPGTGNTTTNGTQYVVNGATNAAAQLINAAYRSLGIFKNTLYNSSAGLGYFAAGLPTTTSSSSSTGTFNAAGTNNTQFVFMDIDPTIGFLTTGYDVLYIADCNTSNVGAGISKFYFKNGAWTFAGIYDVTGATKGITGLTGTLNSARNPVLYAVQDINAQNNSILSIVDAAGRTNAMAAGTTTVTTIATAGAGNIIKGIAFAPATSAYLLPIALTSFNGSLINGKTYLQWLTATELNAKEFVVERSSNGIDFADIGTITAKNSSTSNTYTFEDINPANGTNFYRLKMVDRDGSYQYSNIVVIKLEVISVIGLTVFPNPVVNNVTINHPKAVGGATIKIISIDGKVVTAYKIPQNATQTSLNTSQLKHGQYFINFVNNGKSASISFVK